MFRPRPGIALLLLSLAGCRGPAPAATQASSAGLTERARAERLALLAPDAPSPVDGPLREAQERARRMPDKVEAWILVGRLWARKARETTDPGYLHNADAAAQVALADKPDLEAALDLRGFLLLSEHRFAEARALAERVVKARPDDPMAWGTLSDALLELGEFGGAAEAAQRMVALKPNNPSYVRASYLRWLQGDAAGARQIIRLAWDAAGDPRDPEPRAFALTQAALYFWHQGDYEGARAGGDKALATFAGYPPALVALARAEIGLGDYARAVNHLRQADARSPLIETAWLLGDACEAAGDAACAEAAWQRVRRQGARLDPRTLSQFLSARGEEPERALELAREEAGRRGDLYTRDALAFALLRAGRVAEARAESDRALALGTGDARLLFHAGAIRMAAGDGEGGRQLLRQALRQNPRFDLRGAAEAARLLAPVLAASAGRR